MQQSLLLLQWILKKKSLYQIKYILRLSCIITLACKHKTTIRAFLNRSGSEELLEGFFTKEDAILPIIGVINAIHSLILDPDSSTSHRLIQIGFGIWIFFSATICSMMNDWLCYDT